MDKKKLRKRIAEQKSRHTQEERDKLSREVCNRVLASPQWADAETILLYHALSDEVNTDALIEQALREGKNVLLPVVVADDLELRTYTSRESMKVGAYGILEPTGPVFPPSEYRQIQLVIVPGMAFDSAGHRLGRGKGYYDRLLPRLTKAFKMGICWNFQFLGQIPAEIHDVKMDEIIYNS
ncbi:MAG: 5-formyltetrahydrofolate cyclo-ligase [Bacteroidaceae bacterium]|nr:5-formyltetrahydrofolate cyclo-ligase [Bacteroidaceae bacterium]